MVKLILKYNPDINACDYFGKTALTYAVEQNSLKIAKILFFHKADPWHDKNTNYMELAVSVTMEKLIKKVRKFWIGISLIQNKKKKKKMWKKIKNALRNLNDMNLSSLGEDS